MGVFGKLKGYALAMVSLALSFAGTVAHAALPTGVTAMFTDVGTDVTSALALGWTLFLLVVGGLVIFKIVKKVLSKAT